MSTEAKIGPELIEELRGFIANRVGDEAAQDILQEALAGLTRAGVPENVEELRRMAFTIAMRRVVDHWRRRRALPETNLDTVPAPSPDPVRAIHAGQVWAEVVRFAATLGTKDAETLRRLQDEPTGVALSPTERKARQRLRERLRTHLERRFGVTLPEILMWR